MTTTQTHDVTRLLQEWGKGDEAALEQLTPLVYGELRRLARHYLRGEFENHTLQGTALVHEAYIRLVGQEGLELESRAHFFGVAARLMRQILVDHARRRHAQKRGGEERAIPLEESDIFAPARASDLIALDEALLALARFDPRKSRIVELRYFGGLGIDEIGAVEQIAAATVRRQLRTAEAWLHREMANSC